MADLTQRKVSLNLGAGAARGLAHLGALKVFEENKIPYDVLIGVSMGSIIGSMYSVVPDIDYVIYRAKELLHSQAFQDSIMGTWTSTLQANTRGVLKKFSNIYTKTGMVGRFLLGPSIISQADFERPLFPHIADISIENTRIPFVTVAVDLESGASRVFDKGSMRQAVLASSAMPMVCPPQHIDDNLYVDGGVLDKLGVETARKLGIKKTIVIDVSNEELPEAMIQTGLDVMIRTEDIASQYRRKSQLKKATLHIHPIKGNVHWADYGAWRELIDMGYEETRNHIEDIRDVVGVSNPFRRFFAMFKRMGRKL